MIPAVSKTLAKLFADETSLQGTEQINFNPPCRSRVGKSALSVYCYGIQTRPEVNRDPSSCRKSLRGIDLSFLISAWDATVLGEQQLLSEVLSSLLRHPQLAGDFLAPELQECSALSIEVESVPAIEPVVLWKSLGVPIRPALYVTVKVPG